MKARKPTDTVGLKLRFLESLRRRFEREARRNNRSMNAEIIHRLERSFAVPEFADAVVAALEPRFKGLEAAIDRRGPLRGIKH